MGHRAKSNRCVDGLPAVIWGNVFATDEYRSTGLPVGNLAFDCIDFCENLKLATILKRKLRPAEAIETMRCTVPELAAGVEWASQGQPKRVPPRSRIDVLASGIRLDEFLGAERAMGQTMDVWADAAYEIQSICLDALTADRERAYQAMGMFLLPSIWKYLAREVAAIASQAKMGATFHTYPACPVDNESLIFLISHHGHMMWGNPTAATTSATWRDRGANASGWAGEVVRRVVPCKLRLQETQSGNGADISPYLKTAPSLWFNSESRTRIFERANIDRIHEYPKIS